MASPMLFGVDEVGRGCLAGPVVSACVSYDSNKKYLLDNLVQEGLTDSKKLSESQRDHFSEHVRSTASCVGIGWSSADEIDRYNIRVASLLSMFRAYLHACGAPWPLLNAVRPVVWEKQESDVRSLLSVDKLHTASHTLLIDGRDTIQDWLPAGVKTKAIIGGDSAEPLIAAASVVAKVWRDQWMKVLSWAAPEFELAQHKGYASEIHQRKLFQHGQSYLHRTSFKLKNETIGTEECLEESKHGEKPSRLFRDFDLSS